MFERSCAFRHSAIVCAALMAACAAAPAAQAQQAPKSAAVTHWAAPQVEPDSVTDGSVTVDGKTIQYEAVAGTLVVGSTDAQDVGIGLNGKYLPGAEPNLPANPADRPATARIYYAAYFMKNAPKNRPITFLYNGGPGSSSMYLHMGAFGPERVVLPQDASHPSAAPYKIVPNQYSLLDASDLVFIDAPGTGFSRIYGKNAAKAFYGTDQDAHAFDRFIRRFLNKYNRWNSPKFLFGESYGTTRTAVLSNLLQRHFDLNGSIFLSQILNFDDSADGPEGNPGTENGYILALPSMAATAWYHHRIANAPATLFPWLTQVEHFALGPYASALLQGSDLPQAQKEAIAAKLASYTGLSAAYWLKANLRVSGGEFSHELQANDSITTGRLDTRYQGPALNPLSGSANYDPFDDALTSPYDSAVNQYTRDTLKYGLNQTYKPSAYGPDFNWDLRHTPPGERGWDASVNVMPDLANAMKRNPKLKVLLMGGYYDLGCTFFAAEYEDKHLQIPASLDSNISYHFFETGHMVYVTTSALKQLHQVAADFIRANENGNQ
uniref:Peptidase S10 n=1 Tax=Acidobacterium capsulatum TaxID=33075 RepID=A0A7V4XQC6_9BACT